MLRMATLGLAVLFGSGCFSVVDLAVDERAPNFDASYAKENAKGKKIAVAAIRAEKALTRDRWFRRKLSAAVEGLVIGVIPYPWDLRAWYGPSPIEATSTFAKDGADGQLTEALVKALTERGAEASALDASQAAGGPNGAISVQALIDQAKAAGADALYLVAYNEFTSLRFKNGEDKKGEEIFHEIYKLDGKVYAPSTAVFGTDGGRLLACARTHETIFYTPLLMWGWRTPFQDDGQKFKDTLAFLGEVSGRDAAEASAKTAEFLVKRDFGGESAKAAKDAEPPKAARAATPVPARG